LKERGEKERWKLSGQLLFSFVSIWLTITSSLNNMPKRRRVSDDEQSDEEIVGGSESDEKPRKKSTKKAKADGKSKSTSDKGKSAQVSANSTLQG
jgi:hypothetical protein